MSDDKARWLAENLLGYEWDQKGTVPRKCWWKGGAWRESRYFSTGNGMLEIINAMRERGHDMILTTRKDGVLGCHVHVSLLPSPFSSFHVDGGWFKNAETFPAAVIEAAYSALQEQDDGNSSR